MDPDAAEEAWRQWSTYREAVNALKTRDKLRAKDKQARVLDTRTGDEVDNVRCLFCGEHHPEPHDGSCLL